MYKVTVYNHEAGKEGVIEVIDFTTKRNANGWLKRNTVKRGYDYFAKDNISIEYQRGY